MNDPFNFASAAFTPRNLTSPRTPVGGGPWSGEYKMQHRAFPNSASSFNSSEFSAGGATSGSHNFGSMNSESLNSEGQGSFDPGNADSGNSDNASNPSLRALNLRHISSIGFNPGNMSSGGYNSEGRNSRDLISDAFNSSTPNIHGLSAGYMTSPVNSENVHLNSISRSVKPGNLSAASVNSGNVLTTAMEPSRRSTGISQNPWPPSALSPSHAAMPKPYVPRSSDQSSSTPAKGESASTKSSALPGLLPDDGNNDTFVMDIDDRPEEIIAELKLQIESLVTVIVMARSQENGIGASSVLQGGDGIEIAHRIMNRLKVLRMENEYLGALVSGKGTAILEAKNKRLESENTMLRQQLHDIQQTKDSTKRS